MDAPLVVLTPGQLVEIVEAAVTRALAVRFPAEPPRERLTVDEAAEALRCSARHVRKLVAQGRLRGEKASTGGSSRLLIHRSEIERLLTAAR
jgi:excisionase family DNA binding protein